MDFTYMILLCLSNHFRNQTTNENFWKRHFFTIGFFLLIKIIFNHNFGRRPSRGDTTQSFSFKGNTLFTKIISDWDKLLYIISPDKKHCFWSFGGEYLLYRSLLWVRSYGQLQCLPTSLYRSPMAGTKLADLSLQTTSCKEDEKKETLFYVIKKKLINRF